MTGGATLMAAGVTAARFFRRRPWWLRFHRAAGIAGALSLGAGLAAGVIMVSQGGNGHFGLPHAWLGLTAVTAGTAAPTIGQLQFKFKAKIRLLRPWHRRIGFAALAMCLLGIISGLAAGGII